MKTKAKVKSRLKAKVKSRLKARLKTVEVPAVLLKDYKKLLELSAELAVAIRSWGMHQTGPLMVRDADTGKPVKSGTADLEAQIIKIRKRLKK